MDNERKLIDDYRGLSWHKIAFSGIILILLVIAAFYSIAVGASSISLKQVFRALWAGEGGYVHNIIWNIRLPRVLTAIIAGMGLALAGVVMQSILRNPLGSPFTLGISQAAAFGAAFAIVVLNTGNNSFVFNSVYITTAAAFLMALVSTGFILFLSGLKKGSPETMVLAGIALGSLFNAGTMALQFFADDVELASIVFWTFGDVGRTGWSNITWLAVVLLLIFMYFSYNSWNYNTLSAGDETALSLGVEVTGVRLKGMLAAALLTSLIVSLVGIIGFVGLVTPHIVRRVIGGNEKYLIPAAGLAGGLLLLVADTAARTVIAPVVLPVGILTSFLGAPLFIYLILKGRKYW